MLHDHMDQKVKDEIEKDMLRILSYKMPPNVRIEIEGLLPLVMSEFDDVGWTGAWELICKASVYRAMWRRRQGLPRGW